MAAEPIEANIKEVAGRIRALREDMDISVEEMAQATDRSVEEYIAQENGEKDLSFTFMYKCAKRFGIDVVEILTGENPHLTGYELMRAGDGVAVTKRYNGYQYLHKAPSFKNKLAEPFYVTIPYMEDELAAPHLSYHKGQEFDYVLHGRVRFSYEGRIEDLGEGDSVMYDSGRGHGLAALDGKPCVILAIVIKPQPGETTDFHVDRPGADALEGDGEAGQKSSPSQIM